MLWVHMINLRGATKILMKFYLYFAVVGNLVGPLSIKLFSFSRSRRFYGQIPAVLKILVNQYNGDKIRSARDYAIVL